MAPPPNGINQCKGYAALGETLRKGFGETSLLYASDQFEIGIYHFRTGRDGTHVRIYGFVQNRRKIPFLLSFNSRFVREAGLQQTRRGKLHRYAVDNVFRI